jgi:hypothetical protein
MRTTTRTFPNVSSRAFQYCFRNSCSLDSVSCSVETCAFNARSCFVSASPPAPAPASRSRFSSGSGFRSTETTNMSPDSVYQKRRIQETRTKVSNESRDFFCVAKTAHSHCVQRTPHVRLQMRTKQMQSSKAGLERETVSQDLQNIQWDVTIPSTTCRAQNKSCTQKHTMSC